VAVSPPHPFRHYTGRMLSSTAVRSLFVLVLLLAAAGCNNGSSTPLAPDQNGVPYSQTDLTVGTGTEATVGTTASVQYGGWLYSATAADHKGQQFQASQLAYVVGSTQLIKGFDMAVTGMKVGGVRRAIMPPSLAFGATGSSDGTIPPNAALVFDIMLVAVQ
jgi:FKBP-type peptidyl-prolyl cis-trans isomerase FkpA